MSASQQSFPTDFSDGRKDRLSPELVREAHLDLAARLGYGVYGYALIFIALGITSPYPTEHPKLFWSLAAVVFLSMGARLTLALGRKRAVRQSRAADGRRGHACVRGPREGRR